MYNFKQGMYRFIQKLSLIAVFVFCIFIPTESLFAQGFGGIKSAFIEISPKYPLAGERVKATLSSPSLDTDTALITWTLNGEVAQQAYSEKTFYFNAGGVGDHMTLRVDAEDGSKKRVSSQKDLYISDLVIVWEGKTYTPAFYGGRALASPGAYVAINAIASVTKSDGALYDKKDLSYVWRAGNANTPRVSGFGKNSILLQNENPYESFIVYLEVKDPGGEVRATKKIFVPGTEPKIHLYEDNPYIGIHYDRAIGSTYGIYGGEATVVAEPYFMSVSSRIDPLLNYTWSVGNTTYSSPGSITFGAEGNGFGSTPLSLVIKNSEYWLQSARFDKRIDFGGRSQWINTNPNTTTL